MLQIAAVAEALSIVIFITAFTVIVARHLPGGSRADASIFAMGIAGLGSDRHLGKLRPDTGTMESKDRWFLRS